MISSFYTFVLVVGIDALFLLAEQIIKRSKHIATSAITTIILYCIGLQLSGGIIYFSIKSTKNFTTIDYLLLIFNILYSWWRITDRIQKLNKKYGNL